VTIRRGEDWGISAPLPSDGVVCASDAEARAVVVECRRSNRPLPTIGLTGGDLWAALGSPQGGEGRLRSESAQTFDVDLGEVLVDGRIDWFVAHLVVRRSWWRGPLVAGMNGEWLGSWRVAPRAHPNDGRLDVLDVSDGDLPLRQRWLARRRLVTGDHLPHPQIRDRRMQAVQFEFERPLDLHLDGVNVGRCSRLSIRLAPDALSIVV